MNATGALIALVSAALFGLSPPLAKLAMGDMSPLLLAGILYLGSGTGLAALLLFQKKNVFSELRNLSSNHRWKLLGAIIAGGVIAPLCLAYGIKLATAFEVSVLLNLETVATTLIAWLLFSEYIGKRVWIGKVILICGALLVSIAPHAPNGTAFSLSGLYVVAACVFWGFDNNLTRDVDAISPTVLACIKGLSAGAFNTLLAVLLGQASATTAQIAACMTIGAFSFGASLVLFILALRSLGASRTSTYFAAGPFFGMLFSVVLLGERPALYHWLSAGFMAAGLWTLLKKKHEHWHSHEPITHSHFHTHDEHHQHDHHGELTDGKPHEHVHTHLAQCHSHAHLPDIHHRHSH